MVRWVREPRLCQYNSAQCYGPRQWCVLLFKYVETRKPPSHMRSLPAALYGLLNTGCLLVHRTVLVCNIERTSVPRGSRGPLWPVSLYLNVPPLRSAWQGVPANKPILLSSGLPISFLLSFVLEARSKKYTSPLGLLKYYRIQGFLSRLVVVVVLDPHNIPSPARTVSLAPAIALRPLLDSVEVLAI